MTGAAKSSNSVPVRALRKKLAFISQTTLPSVREIGERITKAHAAMIPPHVEDEVVSEDDPVNESP